MNARLKRMAVMLMVPVSVGALLGLVGRHYLPESIAAQAARQDAIAPPVHLSALNVTLPPGHSLFPPGPGADIANANCVMCHSTGMVLRQPPLTTSEWKVEITKMRNAFGAPISPDQIDALAHYLNAIDGRKPQAGPSGVDNQAS
ncbi:cytochrome c [Burkholderia ambifaria]|uniref:c-type cytochrome n=1 Tax=Burkholderia ambifaria TaxID=152480 RepID=UPI0013FD2E60|nr:cytochrome c [Burkholderia ambifaria]NHL69195.1 cytochrome c [Burkholderia ambifaria]